MPGGGTKGQGGSSGHASNAALDDDSKVQTMHRRSLFDQWKKKKMPNQIIEYTNSPPAVKRY